MGSKKKIASENDDPDDDDAEDDSDKNDNEKKSNGRKSFMREANQVDGLYKGFQQVIVLPPSFTLMLIWVIVF